HDPQAELRRVSPLLAQAEPDDGQAAQPRHVPDTSRGRSARARGAVLQITRLISVAMTLRAVAASMVLALFVAGGCATSGSGPSITTTTPNDTFEQIPVELSKPDGAGPFPAVVIMHDCSGLGRARAAPPAGGQRSWSGTATS